jgi:hypothetical protein
MRDFETAIKNIDELFKCLPEFDSFRLSETIRKSELSNTEKNIADDNDAIEILLVDRLKYAEYVGSNKFSFKLTELGRQVKNKGGHYAYLKSIETENETELKRKDLSDKKLLLDIFNAEFESNQGQKIKRVALILSAFSVILAILGSTLIQKLIFDKKENKKEILNKSIIDSMKISLELNKKQIEVLKEKINSTTIKKEK